MGVVFGEKFGNLDREMLNDTGCTIKVNLKENVNVTNLFYVDSPRIYRNLKSHQIFSLFLKFNTDCCRQILIWSHSSSLHYCKHTIEFVQKILIWAP